ASEKSNSRRQDNAGEFVNQLVPGSAPERGRARSGNAYRQQ
ncbi:MAG: hypothetical protein QOE73_872, partial [Verrucomicrobiota bacterium]